MDHVFQRNTKAALATTEEASLSLLQIQRDEYRDNVTGKESEYEISLATLQSEFNTSRILLRRTLRLLAGPSLFDGQDFAHLDHPLTKLLSLLRQIQRQLQYGQAGDVNPNSSKTAVPRTFSQDELKRMTEMLRSQTKGYEESLNIGTKTVGYSFQTSEPVSESIYSKHPLSTTGPQVRFLTILPGEQDSPVRCTLHAESINHIEQCEALSYTWGEPEATASNTILVNGVYVHARENLYWALRYLRRPHEVRVLWVDAVCINQGDIPERNSQLRLMGDIYRRARQVVVWLGRDENTISDAFEFLKTQSEASRTSRAARKVQADWGRLDKFFQLGYWGRLWIIQEVCLAQHTTIVCGSKSLPWKHITDVRNARKNVWPQYLSEGERRFMRSFPARLDQQRELFKSNTSVSLWSLLETFSKSQCREIHDKIYGLLALASDYSENSFMIDYSRSAYQLYLDVMLFYYGDLRRRTSHASAPQLVALSTFLAEYLGLPSKDVFRTEMDGCDSLPVSIVPIEPPSTTSTLESTLLSIAASRLMIIDEFLNEGRSSELNMQDLALFVEGRTPHSHLGQWREAVDPQLTRVRRTIPSPGFGSLASNFTIDSDRLQQDPCRDRRIFRAIPHEHLQVANPEPRMGIAPPGTCVGDLLCSFVGVDWVLIMRRPKSVKEMSSPRSPTTSEASGCDPIYAVIGQAVLLPSKMKAPFEHSLTANKEVEIVQNGNSPIPLDQNLLWPMTLSMKLSALKELASHNPAPRPLPFAKPPLELMPSHHTRASLDTNHSFQRELDDDQHILLSGDPSLRDQLSQTGFVAVTNLGATGYLSCTLEVLYMLKPIRKIYLMSSKDNHSNLFYAVRDLMRQLHRSSLPVSPLALVETMGWGKEQINTPQSMEEVWRVFTDVFAERDGLNKEFEDLFCGEIMTAGTRLERFYDLELSPIGTSSLENALRTFSAQFNYPRYQEFRAFPPVLVLSLNFSQYSFRTDSMEVIDDDFVYPSLLSIPEEILTMNIADRDPTYQLHGVVVREDVLPINRFLLYLRPRQEDRWIMFFNDTVTFASKAEVFEQNQIRNEATRPKGSWLRTPVMLFYLDVQKLGELLG